MPDIDIRQATPADIPLILQLIRELAEYERDPDAAVATPDLLHRALFAAPSGDTRGAGVAECVIGELDGAAQGFALYFHNFSTWTGKPGLYLEDLFVRPPARRHGLGRALLKHLATIAVQRGCARFEWAVLDWNIPAIRFYESLGAKAMSEWTVYRVSGPALTALSQ